jgi:hypothetical protein
MRRLAVLFVCAIALAAPGGMLAVRLMSASPARATQRGAGPVAARRRAPRVGRVIIPQDLLQSRACWVAGACSIHPCTVYVAPSVTPSQRAAAVPQASCRPSPARSVPISAPVVVATPR